MSYESDIQTNNAIALVLFIVVALVAVIWLIVFLTKKVNPYVRRTRYIKLEIERSHGRERERWKRRLKRHYVRAIPFVGKKIARKMRRAHKSRH